MREEDCYSIEGFETQGNLTTLLDSLDGVAQFIPGCLFKIDRQLRLY